MVNTEIKIGFMSKDDFCVIISATRIPFEPQCVMLTVADIDERMSLTLVS